MHFQQNLNFIDIGRWLVCSVWKYFCDWRDGNWIRLVNWDLLRHTFPNFPHFFPRIFRWNFWELNLAGQPGFSPTHIFLLLESSSHLICGEIESIFCKSVQNLIEIKKMICLALITPCKCNAIWASPYTSRLGSHDCIAGCSNLNGALWHLRTIWRFTHW